jgi:uncharacterized protein (TIGR03083 family)
MTLPTPDRIEAVRRHSAGFAEAARGHLAAAVEHCPGWSVADLVRHLTEVHWFWATIVAERLREPPEESRRPPRVADDDLLSAFEAGAARLADTLGEADQSDHCWTWAPQQQDVAFVTRHQVQEAAVHHWDAARAAGAAWDAEPAVAADAVDEFLRFSVASDADPAEPAREPLAGTFVIRTTDTGEAWTLADGGRSGTVSVTAGTAELPALEAPAAQLLLWLYGRVDIDGSEVAPDLLGRFRGLCFTD